MSCRRCGPSDLSRLIKSSALPRRRSIPRPTRASQSSQRLGVVVGNHKMRLRRDLRRRMDDGLMPPLYCITVPAKNTKTKQVINVECSILLPHELFAYLADQHQTWFDTLCRDLRAFWCAVCSADDPQMLQHPLHHDPRLWWDLAIPITLYGDATRYSTKESMEFTCWSPLLLRKTRTWSSHFVAACWPKSAQAGKETWTAIWRALAWSMDAMFRGQHPITRHDDLPFEPDSWSAIRAGQPLTRGGFFGVVHRVCGDLAWFQTQLDIPQLAPSAAKMCLFCEADRSDHPFKDVSEQAQWKTTVRRGLQPKPSLHPIFSIPGVGHHSVALDAMHVLDLGVLQHTLGNILHTLCYDDVGSPWGSDAKTRLEHIWVRIQELYTLERTSTRFSNLELATFTNPSAPNSDFPCLKGKAAETRCMLPILKTLFEEQLRDHAPPPEEMAYVREMQSLLHSLCHVQRLMIEGPDIPGRRWGLSCRQAMEYALRSYSLLSCLELERRRRRFCRWNVVNKHHFSWHLCDSMQYINAKLTWTYAYEDLVGRSQRACHECAKGTPMAKVGNAFMLRYRRIVAISVADVARLGDQPR